MTLTASRKVALPSAWKCVHPQTPKLLQVHIGKRSTDRDSPKESGFWTYTSPTLVK